MQAKKETIVSFAERLRETSEQRGLKQVDIARLTGITHGAINNYWNKGRVPKAEELHLLAKTLGVTMEWLLTGEHPSGAPAPRPPLPRLTRAELAAAQKEVEQIFTRLAKKI